jgi:hypothetical protein
MQMNISIYSMISALLFFSFGLLIAAVLGFNRRFLLLNSAPFLVILFFLSLVRLVLPVDIPMSWVIRSEDVFPQISQTLNTEVLWHISIKQTFLLVWLLGAIVVALIKTWLIIKESIMTRRLRSIPDRHLELLSEELFGNKAEVVRSPDVDLPIVTGFSKAYIFVPELDIEDKYLRYVLLHEYQHIKGHDIVIKVFYLLLASIFWWNPIIYVFQKELNKLLEIRCDTRVIKHLPKSERSNYLLAILEVIKKASDEKERRRDVLKTEMLDEREKRLNVSFANKEMGYLEQEVSEAMKSKLILSTESTLIRIRFEVATNRLSKMHDYLMAALTVFAVAVFIASYFVIIQPAYFPAEMDTQGFTVQEKVKNGFYIIERQDGTYALYINGLFAEILSKEDIDKPQYSGLEIFQGEIE